MPEQHGIDLALDRLFKNATAERLMATPPPEQLATRSTGLPDMPPLEEPPSIPPPEQMPPEETPPPPPPPIAPREVTMGAVEDLSGFKKVKEDELTWLTDEQKESIAKELSLLKAEKIGREVIGSYLPLLFLPGATQIRLALLPALGKGGLERLASLVLRGGLKPLEVLEKAPGQIIKGIGKGIGKLIPEKPVVAPTIGKIPPEVPKPITTPVLDKISGMWKVKPIKEPSKIGEFFIGIEEKLSDKFAGINKLTARARKNAGGKLPVELDAEMHSALIAGAPDAAKQKAIDTYRRMTKVLGKVDEDFVDKYLMLRHNIDVIAMHPERKIAGGVQQSELQTGLNEIRQVLGDENFKIVEDAASVIKQHYSDLLDAKVSSGLVDKELANLLKTQYPWYNPIKYFEQIAEYSGGAGRKLSVTSSGLRRLSEKGSELASVPPLNTLALATLESEMLIQRNNAAKAIIKLSTVDDQLKNLVKKIKITRPVAQVEEEVIFRPTKGEIGGTLSFMEDGVRQTYEVPQWLEREAKYLTSLPQHDIEKIGSAINAVSKFGMTGANLAFFLPNLGVDTLSAMLTQGVGPLRILKRLALNLKAIIKEDEVLAQLRRSGGSMSGFWGKTPEEIAKEVRKSGNLVIKNADDFKRLLKNPFKLITDIGHAVEMAPRTAVFEKAIESGKTLEQAALLARRVTIDFQRSGTAIRQANSFYLYLNAGVQGAMLPFRALRDNPRARLYTVGYTASILANYAWNKQFPEYEDIPNYAKYGSYVFMLPSEEYDNRGNKVPHYIAVIPNLREWALFSAPIVYALRKLDGKAPEDVDQFLKDVVPGINPISQITGQGGIGVPTQLGSTIVELGLNKDFFYDRPIVPVELQGKPPEEQYNQYTSETARRVGGFLGISPLKLDYIAKNIFGGLGQQVMSAADAVLRKTNPENINPRISELLTELQNIKVPNFPSEEIERKRNEFLYGLSAEDREAVLKEERKPEASTPIITPIARRLYRETGGQIYKTGQALAEKETGISIEQTRNAGKILGEVSNKLQTEQENVDKATLDGQLTMEEWRDAHKTQSAIYRGTLLAMGIQYPDAAQTQADSKAWGEYLNKIYTLASTIPDMRTKGELLIATWRTIQPEEIAPGKMDWETFYAQRDEFRNNLITEDRSLLDGELKQRMTAMEKFYYDFTKDEKLSIYYKLPETPQKARELYRLSNPEFDASLNLWGYVTTLKSEKAVELLQKKASEIGMDYNLLPYFKEPRKTGATKPKIKWAK